MASFCFDGRAALVWLDPLDPDQGTGTGVLCARHADGLTPPRGWYLRDRRPRSPRLWDDRPPMVVSAASPISSVPNLNMAAPVVARAVPAPTDPLPFDDAPVIAATATPPSDDVDDLLDARAPMLARAFAAVRGAGEV